MPDPQWRRNERYANDAEHRKRRQELVKRYRTNKSRARLRQIEIESFGGERIMSLWEMMALAAPTVGASAPADADDHVAVETTRGDTE